MPQQNGQFLQDDYFDNIGGLNISDSTFKVKENQATGGQNYNYVQTGGIAKRRGHGLVNTVADTQLNTLGLNQYNSIANIKFLVRAAGTKLQNVDISVPTFTNLSEDTTAAGTDFLTAGSTIPVAFSQFNTADASILWCVGGGMSQMYGVYSTTKVTSNGTAVPTGSITATASATGGSFTTTGTYFYAVAFRKLGTQAISNADLDTSATIAATTDKVTIDLTGINNEDTTKHDKIYIYRSAVGGVTDFTTGDLIAQVASTATSYVDTGSFISTAQNIPRSGGTVDNSVLPTGTIKTITTFKRRLVTSIGSTVYFSDINKPESWPSLNFIQVPSGGPITGLGVISFTSEGSNLIDEVLCVFKEREIWVITGSSISDFALKFIDPTGCANQTMIVNANGFISFIDYRGIYLWNGTGKPIYCSRPIEPLFAQDGEIDKSKVYQGCGTFYNKQNIIIWSLSSKTYGEQMFQIKMDLRLTLPSVETTLNGRIMDGVFIYDSTTFGVYALAAYLPSNSEEVLNYGDDAGFLYNAFTQAADAGAGYSFKYLTKHLDQGNPAIDKRYHYVIAWVNDIGDWNLTLDWWTDYKTSEGFKSTRAVPITTEQQNSLALWDVAYWDVAYWDDYTAKSIPLMFILSSDAQNNSEGKAIRLQFRQEVANQPVTILGYSILYSPTAMSLAG